MISNRVFLRKVFFISLVFVYQGVCNDAYSGIPFNGGSIVVDDTQIDINPGIVSNDDRPTVVTNTTTTNSVCPAGQYVYKCGNYRVGFNWLKNAEFSSGDTPARSVYVSTKNYYVGEDTLDLFEQMRTFFGHNGDKTILYYDPNGTELKSRSDYATDRNIILNKVCNPSTYTVTCATCPNNANVPETTVEMNNDDTPVSWNFFTIADCYMTNFEDSTGYYFYLPDDIDDDVSNFNIGKNCYYTNTNPDALEILNGDAIGKFIPSVNSTVTIKQTAVSIPSKAISSAVK